MDPTVQVALISGVFTFAGILVGVIASSKLLEYRIKQLEIKVDKHNNMVERVYKLEGTVLELQHDVRDIKAKV